MEKITEYTQSPQTKPPRKKMMPKKRKDLIFVWSMLSLFIVYWIVFFLYVNIDSIFLAFQDLHGTWTFDNISNAFRDLGSGDSEFRIAIKNTMIYFLKDVVMIPLQLFIAYFLHKKIVGTKFFRIMFYLPSLISSVVMVTVYSTMIAPYGPIGQMIEQIFGSCPQFLADSRYATWAIVFYTVWIGWGGNMLLFGGSLARIPTEIFEAAKLDGVGPFRELFELIFPLMWPTLSTVLVLNLTGLFNAGGPILLFDSSQLNVGIQTLNYWMFVKVWKFGASAYNEVAAIGLVLTLIGAPIIMFIRWLIDRTPKVEY
ncbi:MAG: sugar ABC transporter permease [Clostridia bacterium]|nr:sugar ABC transporter permease [Clostridia bacterium]